VLRSDACEELEYVHLMREDPPPCLVAARILTRPHDEIEYACVAMPYAGHTVRRGMYDDDQALKLVQRVARGCKTLIDGWGLFYLDIKPANIAVTEAGEPVLLDYGAMCFDHQTAGVTYPPPRYPRGHVPGREENVTYGLGILVVQLLLETNYELDLLFDETGDPAAASMRIAASVAAVCRAAPPRLRRLLVSSLVFQVPLHEFIDMCR